MRRWRRWAEPDDGSASLEFLSIGMLLLVPLVYLVLVLSQVQGAALAVEGAARQAARVHAHAVDESAGAASAEAAIAVALADVGLEATGISLECSPTPVACLTRGGTIAYTVDVSVPLPLVPPVLDLDVGLSVPLQAVSEQPVSSFGDAP